MRIPFSGVSCSDVTRSLCSDFHVTSRSRRSCVCVYLQGGASVYSTVRTMIGFELAITVIHVLSHLGCRGATLCFKYRQHLETVRAIPMIPWYNIFHRCICIKWPNDAWSDKKRAFHGALGQNINMIVLEGNWIYFKPTVRTLTLNILLGRNGVPVSISVLSTLPMLSLAPSVSLLPLCSLKKSL